MAGWALALTVTSIVSVLAVAGQAVAATIYGIIVEGGQPAVNAPVAIVCGGAQARTSTDVRGTYRLTLAQPARCRLEVHGVSAPVVLYQDPTRYDFEIIRRPAPPRLIRR